MLYCEEKTHLDLTLEADIQQILCWRNGRHENALILMLVPYIFIFSSNKKKCLDNFTFCLSQTHISFSKGTHTSAVVWFQALGCSRA